MRCRTFRCKITTWKKQTNNHANNQAAEADHPPKSKPYQNAHAPPTQTNEQTIKQTTSRAQVATRRPCQAVRDVQHGTGPHRCEVVDAAKRVRPLVQRRRAATDQTEIGRRGVRPRYYSRPICRPFLQWCAALRGAAAMQRPCGAGAAAGAAAQRRRSVADVPMERPYADGTATSAHPSRSHLADPT